MQSRLRAWFPLNRSSHPLFSHPFIDIATADETAVQPGDYTQLTATTLSFAVGEAVKLQAIAIAAVDNAVEELEYFRADLSNLAGTNAAQGQIDANRDSAQIFIVDLSCKYESDACDRKL